MNRQPVAKLTATQHSMLALKLRQTRELLMECHLIAQNAGKGSQVNRLAYRAVEDVEELRCALDNRLARDCPDLVEPNKVYYGPRVVVTTGLSDEAAKT